MWTLVYIGLIWAIALVIIHLFLAGASDGLNREGEE